MNEVTRTQYAKSGNIHIAYQVSGNGPLDLVLVPGAFSHLEYDSDEPRFARFLGRLASFVRLIRFDKRGTGLSDRGPDVPMLEQRMDDVRAVMDAVGIETGSDLKAERPHGVADGTRAPHPSSRSVEGREKAVSCRIDLAATEAGQLATNRGVMLFEELAPAAGREDNIFWRRPAGVPGGRIEAAGAKALSEREAVPLGRDIIHSVINPIKRLTGAIHVYGGDFFTVSKSEWDPERLVEEPYDVDKTFALFEESNRLYPPA